MTVSMLPRTYSEQTCSIARALEVVGERWTLLILRDAFLGVRRFDDFQARLEISRTVLDPPAGRPGRGRAAAARAVPASGRPGTTTC